MKKTFLRFTVAVFNDNFPSVPYFDGLVDDVRIYDRLLDGDEIAGLQ